MDFHGEVLAEQFIRVDDVVGAEGGHVGGSFLVFGTAQHLEVGFQQLDRDGDGEIGMVVIVSAATPPHIGWRMPARQDVR